MAHFFISYAREDADFVEVMKSRLLAAGLENWVDKDRLRAGESWQAAIDVALREAAAVVVVMSPAARASEYVAYEWAFALGAGAPVVPVLARPTPLHPRLDALHYLDFSEREARPWDALFQRLTEAGAALKPRGVRVARAAPQVVHDAVQRLDHAHAEERGAGILALTQIDHPAAQQALRDALRHPMPDVRLEAARALGRCGGSEAAPALHAALADSRATVASAAAVALAKLGDRAAVPLLRELCRQEQGRAGDGAVYALGLLRDAAAVPEVAARLRSSGDYTRALAAFALGRIGGQSVLAPLFEALADENHHVRGESARALAGLGAPAVPGLTARLDSQRTDERVAAAFALSRMTSPKALDALAARRDDAAEARLGSRGFESDAATEFTQRGGGSALYRIGALAADALERAGAARD